MRRKKIINSINFVVMTLLLLIYIAPFAFVFINSYKLRTEIVTNPIKLPNSFDLTNYIEAFKKMKFIFAFGNSLLITIFSVSLIVFFSATSAYYFVRVKNKFNNIMFFIMVASMIIPFQAIMIPLVSIYGGMGLLNNKLTLIFMYLGFGTSLAVFMYHGFVKNIPIELEEAAMIDGANRFKTFLTIVFPLLKPITMTLVTLDVLWIWNDFLLPSLVLMKPNMRTLPLSTFYFFGTYTVDFGLLMAGLMLTIIPVLILYMFLQKYVIAGVMQGSIK
ncbi:carbohydrate ABC transporter permease [Vallitalea guaymasensis]|uniref:carbohydrate ABC transporter permease n=1 Tax=Vallitalea guaymasensis TaxID=1185412 RepID=UPI000DE51A8B|nr:carbohydrate ABC transporter permease [Vallitalea guaymasensis]